MSRTGKYLIIGLLLFSAPIVIAILGNSFTSAFYASVIVFMYLMFPAGVIFVLVSVVISFRDHEPLWVKLLTCFFVIAVVVMGIFIILTSSGCGRCSHPGDASVKANLAQIHSSASIYFDSHNSYGPSSNSCTQSGSLFKDAPIQPSLKAAEQTVKTPARCFSSGDAYAISISLKFQNDIWCVDSKSQFGRSIPHPITGPSCATGE